MKYLTCSGKPRKIFFGPLRNLRFRPTPVTGFAPFYSGAEREVQRAISEHLLPGNVGIDIGANWGIHTLLMAQQVSPHGYVCAFEPFPEAFRELEGNIGLNSFTHVRCWPVAVGDVNGELSFYKGDSSSTGHLLKSSSDHNAKGRELIVQSCRLDDIPEIAQLNRLDLIKIDVEGAESRVLDGAKETLNRFRPVLIIELHAPEQDVAVSEFCLAHGYEIRRLSAGPPIERFDVGWPTPNGVWGTIIAIPEAKSVVFT